ncbi:plastid lipid-associated protein 3, chloroplastic [Malania oleifera]|uniref:plastid lipid-associated protein 3, chloroplastic n=1 Tax=Malania oleifera TaxID=397392 RepID=UPI0025ADD791|nr:plastid lipid-associated protein 3, chloroplastic [Malania oleifera]XP_057978399.1 plastid lipid-associated protein 3, chloroplastic [Malania oleifera]XP_057978401.1 plastid lipid-associated protein 3, chloroplastic [Malania oleifera]
MALFFTSPSSLFLQNPKTLSSSSPCSPTPPIFFSPTPLPSRTSITNVRFSSIRYYSSFSGDPDPFSDKPSTNAGKNPPPDSPAESPDDIDAVDAAPSGIPDEWGEKSEPETSYTKLSEADPAKEDDEWGGDEDVAVVGGNGSTVGAVREDKLGGLKKCLVDTVYGTNFGLQAAAEVRAEVSELVNQLEVANPTPAPTDAAGLLDGNWVLVYTAFSELLPILAAGTTPLLKVEKISQAINTGSLTIENSASLSSPFLTFSFSASAAFEVRTPSRIQVQFKEGTLQPPVIKSNVDLPETVDVFGQKITLTPVQQSLNPLLSSLTSLSRAISGQPPLKIPIPGNRTQSWLLISFLDKDLRISRGDGGLFVLVKEGSRLLDQ